ncbi:hypothetical protein DCAR_0519774 [Daucus carota subsp. sativus]|uniref:Nucleolar protein 6 n=1 Tax=Daucus carota subsp. sativus TaxID=79200 RepID=A0AAF0X503_DAUCS|nr:PREDICTED: nucleolar protein 6 isoform X1 [Daucus carota subsp. sativus]XP_017253163.1 PREDICTED: nucleolar protein 6 isoform X2 [Daucus carota subsp. sativus]WOH00414.1 hypothetical protein DCAR_0519774 [Daucus carota subsp. sativus]
MAREAFTDSMNLKVQELLKEVKLNYSPATTKHVDDVVSSIRQVIDKIPDDIQVTADLAPGFVKDIRADKVNFKFKKPKSIEITGSYSYKCIARPDVNVDVFVQLPKECFHEKDYLNYRYHAKRCLYLCLIKKYLKRSSLFQKVEMSAFQNEARKPVLVLYPAENFGETPLTSIRLIPTVTSLFNVSKLNMQRNNIRASNQAVDATPMYNSSILEDMALEENANFISSTFHEWKELGEALVLLKVWARQRSSIYSHDCISGYLLSTIMAYLATVSGKNRISKSMNTIQICRHTLDFIANSGVWKKGIFFKHKVENNILTEEEREIYLQSFPAVLCHSSQFNVAFRMSKSGLQELQDEASLARNCLDKCRDGGFDELFITSIDFAVKFDHCIRLNLKVNVQDDAPGFSLDNECWRTYEHKVHSLMQEALGERVKLVRVIWRNMASECNFENGLSTFDREALKIGILLNKDEAFNMVVKGPNSENEDEVQKFCRFWGNKAELRIFKDTGIRYCAAWECKPSELHLVMKRITEHILVKHLSLLRENITYIVDQLDFSLVLGNEDPTCYNGHLLEAFNKLSKHLRELNDIPLTISSVQPLDPAFRGTSVCPRQPHPLASKDYVNRKKIKFSPTCIQPVEVLIQLEGSGNWPVDDVAIEKTKSAFILKIGESLQKNFNMRFTATEDDVDVLFSGYAFRLKILHQKGLNLVNRQSKIDQNKRISSTDRKLFLLSQHASMINGLRGRYPIFEPVVRLAKRWVSAHLFSAVLADEAVELLAAYLFTNPLPYSVPCSRITGFLRFLRLLSEYDWTFSPLVVDINGDLNPDDMKEINEKFNLSRDTSGEETRSTHSAMFLATTYDKFSEAWSTSSPSSMELKRLAAYARSSSNLLTKLVLQDQLDSYGWECILRTPLNNYDAVILLHRDKLPYPERLLFPSEVNQGKLVVQAKASKLFQPFISSVDTKVNIEELQRKLMVDFDPSRCLIEDLERRFPDCFKVWYDSLGGDAIGVTWNQEGLKKRGRDAGKEEINLLDELKAVGHVGKGFVRKIYSLKAPRLN